MNLESLDPHGFRFPALQRIVLAAIIGKMSWHALFGTLLEANGSAAVPEIGLFKVKTDLVGRDGLYKSDHFRKTVACMSIPTHFMRTATHRQRFINLALSC